MKSYDTDTDDGRAEAFETTEYEPDKDQKKDQAAVRRKTRRVKAYLSSVLTVVILMAVGTSAWYAYRSHREVDTEMNEVMTPYILYLLNPEATDLLQLAMGSLHPGETKREVICVSNKDPRNESNREIARNINFAYELELAYTENLPVNYVVYQLDPIDSEDAEAGSSSVVKIYGEDGVTELYYKKRANPLATNPDDDQTEIHRTEMYGSDLEGIVNLGRYVTYKKGGEGETLELKVDVSGTEVKYEENYYLIEVSWKDGIQFKDYLKETDLFYIIVKALQPRPEEMTE